jgi:putative transposase
MQDFRTGRHVVFSLHVHLVFVTKYRRNVLSELAIRDLREIFAKVCKDFGSELVECNGEDDHVHLLVTYPPKAPISALVNSLKGVSSRLLQGYRPEIAGRYREGVLWSPPYFRRVGGALLSIVNQYVEHQREAAPPRPERQGFRRGRIR